MGVVESILLPLSDIIPFRAFVQKWAGAFLYACNCMSKSVKQILPQLYATLMELPTTERRALYERLRHKIGSDIVDIMKESGLHYDTLAYMMRVSEAELKEMIWVRDLKMSELVKLLWKMNAEMYPLIRVRKK